MLKNIRKGLLFLGWLSIFAFYPLGNTSLGVLILLLALLIGAVPANLKAKFALTEYKLLGVFSAIILISSLQAVKPFESFTMGLGQILVFFLIFLGADYLAGNREKLQRYFLPLFFTSGLISGAIVVYRYVFHKFRVYYIWRSETLFTGINGTGTVLLVSVALGLACVLNWKSLKLRVASVLALALPALGMVFTFSRGAYLGFVAMMCTILIRSKKMVAIFLLLCILGGAALIIFVPTAHDRLLSSFTQRSNESRTIIWETALQMAKHKPIFGVGPGMFAANFDQYKPTTFKESKSIAHNLELQILAEFGFPGLIIFLALIMVILQRNVELIRKFPDKLFYRCLLGALVGYLVHNQVDGTMVGFELGTFFWVLAGFVVHEHYYQIRGRGE